eukprot:9061734-Pyramimonas_sp.AAC.1
MESSQERRQVVTAMAQCEKIKTQGDSQRERGFRLAADGLDRACRAEIGTAMRSIPKTGLSPEQ